MSLVLRLQLSCALSYCLCQLYAIAAAANLLVIKLLPQLYCVHAHGAVHNRTSRGGFELVKIMSFLQQYEVKTQATAVL
jgi:hypothetical protein